MRRIICIHLLLNMIWQIKVKNHICAGGLCYDSNGEQLLDAMAGLWVNIGYGREELASC